MDVSHSDPPPEAEDPDAPLLALYGRGDERAAHTLAARLMPGIYAHAARVLGDRAEAEDVAQEAMLRLWKVAPDWEEGRAKVRTWLYRVVVNLCTDRLRKRGMSDLDSVPEPADPALGQEARLVAADRQTALEAALAQLPERQRQATVLRHIEGLSNPEIAEIMGVGVEAVESLTARGKRGLKQVLGGAKEALGYEDD